MTASPPPAPKYGAQDIARAFLTGEFCVAIAVLEECPHLQGCWEEVVAFQTNAMEEQFDKCARMDRPLADRRRKAWLSLATAVQNRDMHRASLLSRIWRQLVEGS